jgi:hypothetical protein
MNNASDRKLLAAGVLRDNSETERLHQRSKSVINRIDRELKNG